MVLGNHSFFFVPDGRTNEREYRAMSNEPFIEYHMIDRMFQRGREDASHFHFTVSHVTQRQDRTDVNPSTPQRDRFQGNFSQQLIFRACGYASRMGLTFILFNDVTLYDFTNERGSTQYVTRSILIIDLIDDIVDSNLTINFEVVVIILK